jgi:hypothetical protein
LRFVEDDPEGLGEGDAPAMGHFLEPAELTGCEPKGDELGFRVVGRPSCGHEPISYNRTGSSATERGEREILKYV